MNEWRHFFRKIYLSLYSKGLCVRGELETEQRLQHIDPSAPPTLAVRLSHSLGLLNWEPGGPALCWELVLTPRSGTILQTLNSNWLKLPVHRVTYCFTPTQFKPSTVKVIPWHPQPDAPVIYTGAFFILTAWPGQRPICNIITHTQQTVNMFDTLYKYKVK